MKENLIQLSKEDGKKYAVALSAVANRGKTSTLKLFIDEFRKEGIPIVDIASMGNGCDEMWCFDKDGVRIGVATGGDDDSAVNMAFKFFEKNACQVVFCATRYKSDSSSWSAFYDTCKNNGYELDWQGITEYSKETFDVMNRDIAMNVLWKML